jgi:hypothetical protein
MRTHALCSVSRILSVYRCLDASGTAEVRG